MIKATLKFFLVFKTPDPQGAGNNHCTLQEMTQIPVYTIGYVSFCVMIVSGPCDLTHGCWTWVGWQDFFFSFKIWNNIPCRYGTLKYQDIKKRHCWRGKGRLLFVLLILVELLTVVV